MRILLASVDFGPHCDGVSTLSCWYARRLVELATTYSSWGPKRRATAHSIASSRAECTAFRAIGSVFARGAVHGVVARRLFRRRPDLVLAMNTSYAGIPCLFLSFLPRFRYVTMAYGLEFLKLRRSASCRDCTGESTGAVSSLSLSAVHGRAPRGVRGAARADSRRVPRCRSAEGERWRARIARLRSGPAAG